MTSELNSAQNSTVIIRKKNIPPNPQNTHAVSKKQCLMDIQSET